MLLAPGPIPHLSAVITPPAQEDPGFRELVAAATSPLDELESGMDAALAAEAIIDLAPPDDGLDVILNATESDLATFSAFDGAAAADALDSSQAAGVLGIVNAYKAIPGEAWQPVPQPLNVSGGAPGGPTLTGMETTITNLSRPGATDFFPGERYSISVALSASVTGAGQQGGHEVFVATTQDGGNFSVLDFGTTDANGNIVCSGVVQDADVGAWTLRANSDDGQRNVVLGPSLSWTVNPLPAGASSNIPQGEIITGGGLHPVCTTGSPGTIAAPTVDLQNDSGPKPTAFTLGDQWTLYVTGSPLQDVLIWATLNGVALPKIVIGKTDQAGNFQLSGAFDQDAYLGVWQEFYQVGVTVVGVTLFYTVSARATAAQASSTPALPAAPPASPPPGGATTPGTGAPNTGAPATTAPGLGPGGILG